MRGYSAGYWIRLDFIKGDSWALAELHALLRAIIVFIVFYSGWDWNDDLGKQQHCYNKRGKKKKKKSSNSAKSTSYLSLLSWNYAFV